MRIFSSVVNPTQYGHILIPFFGARVMETHSLTASALLTMRHIKEPTARMQAQIRSNSTSIQSESNL